MWKRTHTQSPHSRSWLVNSMQYPQQSAHHHDQQYPQHRHPDHRQQPEQFQDGNEPEIGGPAADHHSRHDVLAIEYAPRSCCCRHNCQCYTPSTRALALTADVRRPLPATFTAAGALKMPSDFHTSAARQTARHRVVAPEGSLAPLSRPPTAARTSRNANTSPSSSSLASPTARRAAVSSSPCLNQIIEVLLAILLVNCLCTMPCIEGSYAGDERTAYGPYASDAETATDSRAFPFYRSGERSSSGGTHPPADQPFGFQPDFAVPDAGMLRSFPLYAAASHSLEDFQSPNQLTQQQRSQNFKISPKPCSIGRIEGTCMFVWECIKSEGRHVGMCVDSFMFGSCCAHNYTDNIVMPPSFAYTRPTKPLGMSGPNQRPRPPHLAHKPSISGMTTIERPHGAGTLVIRPSGPHHQGALHRPQSTTTASTTASATYTTTKRPLTTKKPPPHYQHQQHHWTSNTVLGDLHSSPSVVATTTTTSGQWNSVGSPAFQQQQHDKHHWHMPTEPNFVTKPRPPNWEKPHVATTIKTTTGATLLPPLPSRPKPTRKPIISPANSQQTGHTPSPQHQQQTPLSSMDLQTTRKPATTLPTARPSTSSTTTTTISTSTHTTTTTAPKRRPTRPQPPAQQTHYTTVISDSKYPSTPPAETTTSVFSYSRPTPSLASTAGSTAAAAASSSPRPGSTEKYRPTTTASTSRPSSSSSVVPAASSTSANAALQTTTTKVPVSVAASTVTSSAPEPSPPTTISHNLNTIESNEIIDSQSGPSANKTSIKTISAARSECGVPVLARPETRIVGGKSAAFGRWPWQVSVRRTSFFGFSSTHRCGGALLNENWIATAGHCVDDLLITQIRIRVGEYDFSHVQEQLPYIERAVSKKVVHPKYNFFTYEYDLALVKLEQPLEFAPHVSPICLPETDSLLIGQNATVTGWGRLSEGGTLPSVLQEVSVPIVSNDNCKTMFLRAGRQEFIPEIFLCAGYETGGQDSCQGDSGGPLQVKAPDGRFFLAGIISWGIGCAEANLPGVCTRISKFVPWIIENVKT